MVKLAKKMEAMDPRDWHVEGEEFDHTIKQETNSSVITLVANHLYKNDKRPKGMTVREIVTSLQYLSRSEMMIGKWSQDDGEKLLLMANDALIKSLDDDDMCPTLIPGLYLKVQQLSIEKDELDHRTMKNIVKKYLSRWYTSIER